MIHVKPGAGDRLRVVALRSSPSLVDVAYEAVVEAILDQRLSPGERMTIDQIARDLDMSITPVREALTRVAADGLLVQARNRGFAVPPLLTGATYHQLFAARRLLEAHAAANARPAANDLDTLERALKKMAALKPSADYAKYRRFNQLDHSFHQGVIALCRNPFIEEAWQSLHFHLQMCRLYVGEGVIDHDDAVHEHASILQALRQGGGEAAAQAVRAHVDGAEQRLLSLLPTDSHVESAPDDAGGRSGATGQPVGIASARPAGEEGTG
jgi:DNA-binding GntR family transcriptional regulator